MAQDQPAQMVYEVFIVFAIKAKKGYEAATSLRMRKRRRRFGAHYVLRAKKTRTGLIWHTIGTMDHGTGLKAEVDNEVHTRSSWRRRCCEDSAALPATRTHWATLARNPIEVH